MRGVFIFIKECGDVMINFVLYVSGVISDRFDFINIIRDSIFGGVDMGVDSIFEIGE